MQTDRHGLLMRLTLAEGNTFRGFGRQSLTGVRMRSGKKLLQTIYILNVYQLQ